MLIPLRARVEWGLIKRVFSSRSQLQIRSTFRGTGIEIVKSVSAAVPATYSISAPDIGTLSGVSVVRPRRPLMRDIPGFVLSDGLNAVPIYNSWGEYEMVVDGRPDLRLLIRCEGLRNDVRIFNGNGYNPASNSVPLAIFPMFGCFIQWDISELIGPLGEMSLHVLGSGMVERCRRGAVGLKAIQRPALGG